MQRLICSTERKFGPQTLQYLYSKMSMEKISGLAVEEIDVFA